MSNPANPYLGSQSPEYLGGECGASHLNSSHLVAVAADAADSTPVGRVERGALRGSTSSPHLGRGSFQPVPTNPRPFSPAARAVHSSSVHDLSEVEPILGRGDFNLGEVAASFRDAFGLAQVVIPQGLQQPSTATLDNTTTTTLLVLLSSLTTCFSSFVSVTS